MLTPEMQAQRDAETQAATLGHRMIKDLDVVAMTKAVMVWIKWNDAAQAYRILAIWALHNDKNPRFVVSLDMRLPGGNGAAKMLIGAHNTRKDPDGDVFKALGQGWTDPWTQ